MAWNYKIHAKEKQQYSPCSCKRLQVSTSISTPSSILSFSKAERVSKDEFCKQAPRKKQEIKEKKSDKPHYYLFLAACPGFVKYKTGSLLVVFCLSYVLRNNHTFLNLPICLPFSYMFVRHCATKQIRATNGMQKKPHV